MSELLAVFRQHLAWSLIVGVVIFTIFTARFANGRLIEFASGLWRVLAAFVTVPIAFLRRASTAVVTHSEEAESQRRASGHDVLSKGMLVLHAVVIVAAVAALAGGVVATYKVFVPPEDVRRAARDYAVEVETQRKTTTEAAAAMTRLDAEWAQKEQAVVGAYRKDRQTRIAGTSTQMTAIAANIRNNSGQTGNATFDEIQQTIASRTHESADDLERTKRRLDAVISGNWYWLGGWRTPLQRWNELWLEKSVAEYELASLSVESLRAGEQPAYPETKAVHDREAQTLAEMEQVLMTRREEASLKWKAGFFRALRALASVLLFVWFIGVLVEGGALAIRVANDVRRMRETASPDVAGVTTSSSEVRLPVQASVPPRSVASPPTS